MIQLLIAYAIYLVFPGVLIALAFLAGEVFGRGRR